MVSTETIIPSNFPHVSDLDRLYVAQCLSTNDGHADGPFSHRAAAMIARVTGGSAALLTPSGTHALELACALLDLQPGDEVIVPSFTFSSTATAVVAGGGVPVFVDVLPSTLNIDPDALERAITDRTRAVIVMHYGGVACDMDAIRRICREHDLHLIEDNAHGFGGYFRDEALGSIGALGAQSFHATKNVQCGEGGALVVNDDRFYARAEVIREKGTDRSRFLRGEVDKYTWRDKGSSLVLAELLAAQLTAQLERMDEIQAARHRIWDRYQEELRGWAEHFGVARPVVPEGCRHPAHLFHLVFGHPADRDRFLTHMRDHGVQSTFHYVPLDSSPGGRRFGRPGPGGCPVAHSSAARLARLPLYPDLEDASVDRVLDAVRAFEPSHVSSAYPR